MASRLTRHNHGKSHSYRLDGYKVPGVTTVLSILDKPVLVAWAAKETAAYADDHWAELSELRSAERIERLTKARFQTNRRAIVRGNRIHALGERVSRGEAIPKGEIESALVPWVEGYARMLDAWEIEILHAELPVANTEYRYAGTLDAIGYSPRLGTVLLDIKTGSGVYNEVALQLAAYRYANLGAVREERTGPRGGKLAPDWADIPLPEIDTCMVAHVQEDGTRVHLTTSTQETWITFLHMLEVYETWVKRVAWENRDHDFAMNPISNPIYPEDHPKKEER